MADPQARNEALKKEREEMMKTMSPEEQRKALFGRLHHPLRKFRQYDFRLSEREEAVFREHGFVVSERLQAHSFAEAYYRIYTDDLPVFVSADSALHAWHRSFDAMLSQLEEQVLAKAIGKTLHSMSLALQDVCGVRDADSYLASADVFLTVAATLLDGQKVPAILGEVTDKVVATIAEAVDAEERKTIGIFGVRRETDFSMMKPRGRYTRTPGLQRYFRCLSWLGRADLRVGPPTGRDPAGARSQLACALTLLELAQRGGVMETLETFDELIRCFVGERDCAGLTELARVCRAAGPPPGEMSVTSPEHVERIYQELMKSRVGVQRYAGDIYDDGEVGASGLPRSICMMGQRFILDSWMLTTLVYDGKNGLDRRVPSALDVAFGALGNNAALPHLVRRMEGPPALHGGEEFVPFRDGVDYGGALAEARRGVDALGPKEWASSIYALWMASLRALSPPHPWADSADCLGTPSWQAREMNTQLASWTQLRHDTVLYAKQGFTCTTCCEYPAGLVEPRPEFWRQMQRMSVRAAAMFGDVDDDLLDALQSASTEEGDDPRFMYAQPMTPKRILARMTHFLDGFGKTMGRLHEIAEAQLARSKLTDEQEDFLKRVMEERHGSGGSRFLGWYPQLFYASREDSGKREVLVTDVHTDPADPNVGDPGCVLHEGVGNVHVMLVVADTSGPEGPEGAGEPCCYAGPVFSHYEFLAPSGTRLTDQEWQHVLDKGDASGVRAPAHPAWTQPWLVAENAEERRARLSRRAGGW